MTTALRIHTINEPGYHSLVYTDNFTVTMLNYDESMAPENAQQVVRHNKSDEVFILLKGRAILYYIEEEKNLQVIEIRAGLLYTINKELWHDIVATPIARFAIINNPGTYRYDTQTRLLTPMERERLERFMPKWLFKVTRQAQP